MCLNLITHLRILQVRHKFSLLVLSCTIVFMSKKKLSQRWSEKQYGAPVVSDVKDVHPITIRLLAHRGILKKEEVAAFLYPDYELHVHSPQLFVEMGKVIERVGRAISSGERVGVFGDHDVDGISGATILADALDVLGLEHSVYIPSKHNDGHGINRKAIDLFRNDEVTLLISVDCGISNVQEVDYAKECDMDTIIIDHHHVPDVVPDAYAIINPQDKNSGYPFKDLCGTACAYKVVQALYSEFAPEKSDQLKWMLDVVGVGTIADCMPLLGENRVLVRYGLMVLAKTKRIGYSEMIDVGEIGKYNGGQIDAQTVAFQIAPRINAAGRMAEARDAYDFMRENDQAMARIRAKDLEQKNIDRRALTEKLTKDVEKYIKAHQESSSFLFVYDESYPIGIVGIVAGRIAQKYKKPTGVFVVEGEMLRGSFRSARDISMIEILDYCSKYLESYGGHVAAAGAVLRKSNAQKFFAAADEFVRPTVEVVDDVELLEADVKLDAGEIDENLAHELQQFEPFGHGNPVPLFWITGLTIESVRSVGKTGKHLKVVFSKVYDHSIIEGIGFGLTPVDTSGKEFVEGDDVELFAKIEQNDWQGRISVQLNIVQWRRPL